MVVSSYHFLVGPVVALATVGLLALVLRWAFSTDHRDERRDREARRRARIAGGDYGLLVPIRTVAAAGDAESLQALLVARGIRATVGAAPQGGWVVLVFRSERHAAERLLAA